MLTRWAWGGFCPIQGEGHKNPPPAAFGGYIKGGAGQGFTYSSSPSFLANGVIQLRGYTMYTPEFSYHEGVTFRRLAWALDLPMTKTMDKIISLLPSMFPPSEVCPKCKDKSKCEYCEFSKPSAAEKIFLSA